jgi:hypothetical protein
VREGNFIITAPYGNLTCLAGRQGSQTVLTGHSVNTCSTGIQNPPEVRDVCILDQSHKAFFFFFFGGGTGVPVRSLKVNWEEHGRGGPRYVISDLSVLCCFYEVVEPDMQDIMWGWNILED